MVERIFPVSHDTVNTGASLHNAGVPQLSQHHIILSLNSVIAGLG